MCVCLLLQGPCLSSGVSGSSLACCEQEQPLGLTPRQPLSGRSCFLLGPDNRLRQLLHAVSVHPWFEGSILVLIGLSSVALALDMPSLDPQGTLKKVLEAWDCIFALLFLAEAVIKVRWGS